MPEDLVCAVCGAQLTPGAFEGLCPACLLKRGLETQAGATRNFTPPAPDELARYFPTLEILELLGRGGMGVVYKARQRQLDRFVALKILSAPGGRDPAFAERFAREAQALARLSHPNIVAVHDSGQIDGLCFFLMEYVDGLNLRQVLAAAKMTPREALDIVPQVCDALQYAHDQGIVHRDIKPENILLDKAGRVKIADFGIAKIAGREATDFSLTGAGDRIGTPAYMAPEQVEHPQSVDHRADIYSLGVVFYQMLTGELPLGRFAPPSRKVQIDVRLDDVVLRSLEKEPELRYQHASEVKTQVETIADTDPPAPIPAAAWPGVDYRSKATLFGLPLLHVASGVHPATGRMRVARGIFAIGNVAYGVFAMGGSAFGVFVFGGLGVGLFTWAGFGIGLISYAGFAAGLLALGGFAFGVVAMGGSAIGYWADGAFAYGKHVMSAAGVDPAAQRFFEPWAQHIYEHIWVTWIIFPFILALNLLVPLYFRLRQGRVTGGKGDLWLSTLLQALGVAAAASAMALVFYEFRHAPATPARPATPVQLVDHPVPAVSHGAPSSSAPQQRGLAFAMLLADGKFAAAAAQFDSVMRAALPEMRLEQLWKQLDDAGGKFLGAGPGARTEKAGPYTCVYVPCRWERNKLNLKVVFDTNGQVTGLWVVPPDP